MGLLNHFAGRGQFVSKPDYGVGGTIPPPPGGPPGPPPGGPPGPPPGGPPQPQIRPQGMLGRMMGRNNPGMMHSIATRLRSRGPRHGW